MEPVAQPTFGDYVEGFGEVSFDFPQAIDIDLQIGVSPTYSQPHTRGKQSLVCQDPIGVFHKIVQEIVLDGR